MTKRWNILAQCCLIFVLFSPLLQAEELAIGEIGRVDRVSKARTLIPLKGSYENPVVILSGWSGDNLFPQLVASEVGPDGFELLVPEGMAEKHAIDVDYLVIESGNWKLSNGSLIQAGNMPVQDTWQKVPVAGRLQRMMLSGQLFSTLQSDRLDMGSSRTRQRYIDALEVSAAASDAVIPQFDQNIGWLVVATKPGQLDHGMDISSALFQNEKELTGRNKFRRPDQCLFASKTVLYPLFADDGAPLREMDADREAISHEKRPGSTFTRVNLFALGSQALIYGEVNPEVIDETSSSKSAIHGNYDFIYSPFSPAWHNTPADAPMTQRCYNSCGSQSENNWGWTISSPANHATWWENAWNNDTAWGHIYFQMMVPTVHTLDRSCAVYLSNGPREEYLLINGNGIKGEHGNKYASVNFRQIYKAIAAGYSGEWLHVYVWNSSQGAYNLLWSPYKMGYTVNGQNIVAFGDFSWSNQTTLSHLLFFSYDR